jgi:hypothetical protein
MHPDRLIELHPRLYHMAEADTWPSIKTRGLLSTSAVLDHFGMTGAERRAIEQGHRPTKLAVGPGAKDAIVLRDQLPMPPDRIARALGPETSVESWYAIINAKVFFWADETRLHILLNARQYRGLEHDVLTIDTASLVEAHAAQMWLCHMNSGNTFPYWTKRDPGIFKRIDAYPVNRNNKPVKPIVEVLVDHAVPDIADHVVEVWRMRGSEQRFRIA